MRSKLGFYSSTFKEIEKGKIAPVYLLAGAESYIMDELAGRIAGKLVSDDLKSFNQTVSYGAETDADTFISAAHAYPFMADKKVLILKEMERLRGSWKRLVEYCASPVDSSVVVLLFSTHDENGRRIRPPRDYKKLESAVGSSGRVLKIDKLEGPDLEKWVCSKGKRLGMVLDRELAKTLVATVGKNLYDLVNELEKLALVFEGKTLQRNDLEQVVGGYRVGALFDLMDDIAQGKEKVILGSLSRIINTGAEKPSVVIYHLIRHFLSLLKIKAGYGGGGYVYEKLKGKAGRFSTREILVWLENLRRAELVMKSSSFPDELLCASVIIHSMRRRYMTAGAGTTRAG